MLEMGNHCTHHRREGQSLRGDSWKNQSQNPGQKERRAGSPGGASESPEISHTPAGSLGQKVLAEGLTQNGTALILTCVGAPGVSTDTGSSQESSESTWKAAKGRLESGRPGPRTPGGSRVSNDKGTSLHGEQEGAQGREGDEPGAGISSMGLSTLAQPLSPREEGPLIRWGGGSQSGWAAVMVTAIHHSCQICVSGPDLVFDCLLHTCGQGPPSRSNSYTRKATHLVFLPSVLPITRNRSLDASHHCHVHWAMRCCYFASLLPPRRADFLSPFRPLISPALLRWSPEWLPCLLSSPLQIHSHPARAISLPKEHIRSCHFFV